MADVYTRIGYIKGATGAQGAQGAKGDTGDAATIEVGTVTTVPYGQTASVVNSGTSGAAVFDFTIPQGKPGEQTTDMQNLTLGSITTSAASFPIPAVGETGKVLWGKVTKWFSDMAALVATKLDAANVVNNLTTTTSGYALDARMGAKLAEYASATYTNSHFKDAFTVFKSGTLGCVVYAGSTYAIGAYNNYYDLFTVPTEYRPPYSLLTIAADSSGAYNGVFGITTGGVVRYYNFNKNIPDGVQYRLIFTYPIRL